MPDIFSLKKVLLYYYVEESFLEDILFCKTYIKSKESMNSSRILLRILFVFRTTNFMKLKLQYLLN